MPTKMKEKMKLIASIVIAMFITQSLVGQSTSWKVDPSHSSIGFSVDHLVISETVGEFNQYEMDIRSDDSNFTDASFEIIIKAESIDTKDADRDKHLRSADFFDVEQFPEITFVGKRFKKVEGKSYKVTGDLTIHGITKSVEFDAEFGGIVNDPWGGVRAGLKLWGEIDRYDFGLKYNSVLEAGGLAIGQEVRIACRLELIKG